jgi:hypothetical protein
VQINISIEMLPRNVAVFGTKSILNVKPLAISIFFFSRTEATSKVMVATYGAFEGLDGVAAYTAAVVCPREEGTAKAINPAATIREVIPELNLKWSLCFIAENHSV